MPLVYMGWYAEDTTSSVHEEEGTLLVEEPLHLII